jgi:hypothetical protein
LSVDGGVRNASSASSATSNRPLSALRPDQLQRIAYVQNAMEPSPPTVTTTGSSASVEPKRQNVPSGNGAVDGVPSEKAGQQVHGLVGHPCEVLYLEGAAVATVVRPSSLPLDAHRSSLASSNLMLSRQTLRCQWHMLELSPVQWQHVDQVRLLVQLECRRQTRDMVCLWPHRCNLQTGPWQRMAASLISRQSMVSSSRQVCTYRTQLPLASAVRSE